MYNTTDRVSGVGFLGFDSWAAFASAAGPKLLDVGVSAVKSAADYGIKLAFTPDQPKSKSSNSGHSLNAVATVNPTGTIPTNSYTGTNLNTLGEPDLGLLYLASLQQQNQPRDNTMLYAIGGLALLVVLMKR